MPDPMASTAPVHLTFRIGEEDYGLPLVRVAQTVSDEHIAPLPTAPLFLKGLVSVGGTAVPVVDLSLRFGGARVQKAAAHRSVLTVRVRIRDKATLMGLLIDRLGRVIRISPEQVQPPDAVDALLPHEFLDGIVERDGGFVLLMDVDRVLDADESAVVSELAGEAEIATPETRRTGRRSVGSE